MLVNALHRAGVPCEAHLFEKVTPGIHGLFFYVAVCLGFGHVLVLHKAAFCPADQPHLCDLFL